MNKKRIISQLQTLSLSFFRKDFFGIYHGSISAKTENSRFLINTKDAVFDSIDENSLIELYFQKDYRWNQASVDAQIHHRIYATMSDAKFITFTMPPFISSFALHHTVISPKDYFGYKELGSVEIYDPKNFDDWFERAESEIAKYFLTHDTHLMVIRGYGVFAYNRNITEMAKEIAILERSCRLLTLDNGNKSYYIE